MNTEEKIIVDEVDAVKDEAIQNVETDLSSAVPDNNIKTANANKNSTIKKKLFSKIGLTAFILSVAPVTVAVIKEFLLNPLLNILYLFSALPYIGILATSVATILAIVKASIVALTPAICCLVPIAAIVLGIIALKKSKKDGTKRLFPILAIIIGAVSWTAYVLITIVIILITIIVTVIGIVVPMLAGTFGVFAALFDLSTVLVSSLSDIILWVTNSPEIAAFVESAFQAFTESGGDMEVIMNTLFDLINQLMQYFVA